MAGSLQKIQSSGGIQDIAQLFTSMSPMFGSGTSTVSESQTSSADPGSLNQADELLKKIMADSSNENFDAMISNILTKAKQEFGPAIASSKAAGVRSYSDSVLHQMGNEAMARATAQAAEAKINAINTSNKTAASLVEAKLQATKTIQQSKTAKTGASPLGKASALALGGAQVYSLSKKLFKKDDPFNTDSTGMIDGTGGVSIDDFDSSFSAPAGSGIGSSAESFSQDLFLNETAGPLEAAGALSGDTATAFAAGDGVPSGLEATPLDAATFASGSPEAAAIALQGMSPADIQTVGPIGTQKALEAQLLGEEGAAAGDAAAFSGDLAADAGSNFAAELGTNAASEVGTDAAVEAVGDFALPPGTFTVVNAITGGGLGEAVGETAQAVSEIPIVQNVGDEILEPIGSAIQDVGDGISNIIQDIGDSCFITTAATNGGELDNGFTLAALREFRQTYMQQTPERQSELIDYFLLAPLVVKRINESSMADSIWEKIRTRFLAPAVASHLLDMPQETYQIYKDMMYWARQQVGLANV